MDNIIYSFENFARSWLEFILSSSLQLGIFLVLIAVLTFIFRKQSAKFLYILWLIGLLKVLVPPTITIPDFLVSANIPIEPSIFILPIPDISFIPTVIKTPELSYKGYLLLSWISGILLISAVWIYNNFRFHRKIKRSSISIDNPEVSNLVKYKNSRIRFYTGTDITIPFTRDIFKPKIFLPGQALTWSKNELRAVVLHEYAHIKRKDILVIAFQNLIQILFFFHPLVWIANIQIARFREKACDDFAINAMKGNSVDYSKFLLKSIDNAINWQPIPSMSNYFNQSKKSLLNRFEYILNRKENVMNKFSRFQKFVFLFLVIFGVAISCHKKQLSSTTPVLTGQETIKVDDSKDQTQMEQLNNQFSEYDIPPRPIGGGVDIFELNEYALKAGVLITLSIDGNGDYQSTKFTMTDKFNSKEWKNYFETESRQSKIGKIKWTPAQKDGKAVSAKIIFPFSYKRKKLVAEEIEKGKAIPIPIIPTLPPPPPDSDDVQFIPYDEPPKPIGGFAAIQKNLHYPELAIKAGIEGTVIIYAKIDIEGVVTSTKIVKPLGKDNGCNEAAVQALKSIKWIPAKQKEKFVAVWVSVPVKFKLSQKTKVGLLVPGSDIHPEALVQSRLQQENLKKLPYDTPPEPVGGIEAIYKNLIIPKAVKELKLEGKVEIYTKINKNGEIVETRAKKSLCTDCEKAAISALKNVKWVPAKLNDKPVAVWVNVPIYLSTDGDWKRLKQNDRQANMRKLVAEHIKQVPPPPPPIQNFDDVPFVAYDEYPEPVGGFDAIQKNLQYPKIARKAGIEGIVSVYVKIDTNGIVTNTKIARPLGKKYGCNEAAVQAVKSIKWIPAKQKGNPVTVWVSVPVKFNLPEEKTSDDKLGMFEKKIMKADQLYQKGDYAEMLKILNELKSISSLSSSKKAYLEEISQLLESEANTKRDTVEKKFDNQPSDDIKFVPYDVPPKPIGGFPAIQKNLAYPSIAHQAGVEGTVIIYAKVSTSGEIIDTKVQKPLGNSGCNEAAIDAIKSVEWKPALQKDKPVTVWVSVPVEFKLR